MRKRWIAAIVASSMLAGAGGTYIGISYYAGEEIDAEKAKTHSGANENSAVTFDIEKMESAYQLILNSYVEEVESEELAEGAIQGMLATLDDPYSVYMDEESARQFNEALESSFEGIGAEVSKVDGKIVIVSPFKDSPAEKAGLKPDDEILKVDGDSVEGLDLNEATLKIRGEKGTKVKLEIARTGLNKPLQIEVKRDEIPQITVYSEVKKVNGKKIGYMEITSFSEDTASEFSDQLKKLEKEDVEGLLIDVRGNPGGFLTSVEEILGELVTKEKPFVQIEQRNGERSTYFSEREEKKDYPIAVLIDKGSASASEILAGALKEAGGYTLIGEKTFGKGTVQQPMAMGDGSNIKLTLFKWLTPDGNWIHKKGIEPTLEVTQPDLYRTHPLQLEETLKMDMNAEEVQFAQEILTALGFEPGRADGYFSTETEVAVRAFQRMHDLETSGEIDGKTAQALQQAVLEEIKNENNDLQLQAGLKYLAQ
ncbi:S41 family peptidase [Cytobacillus gottheilii]|uniref:PDZ domain-containing protein n=1 Tax=Cytobacillus gottheilii TaxID=859144 RepID=A0ABX8FBE7_9BACI|nr:S41 family peptidase [Cytobacillus gottheilii]QVY61178.1 PDZ domain-containing protein [Cytobacillus gottheilii]